MLQVAKGLWLNEEDEGMRGACTGGRIAVILLWTAGVATGCRGLGGEANPKPFDPLYGDAPPRSTTTKDESPLGSTRGDPKAPLPAPEDPGTTTSLAAIAPGDRSKNASKLRISSAGIELAKDAPADVWRGPKDTGVVLRQPQPISEKVREAVATEAPIRRAGGLSSQIVSVEQGIRLLEQRGAIGTRLERVPGQQAWRFLTSIPHPDNERQRQTYVGTDKDPLAAVRAVLEKVEERERQLQAGG